jgi:hypothetical protein
MLSLARESGQQDLVDLFLAHGAKMNTEKPALLLPYKAPFIVLYKTITDTCCCKKRKTE